jgi:hypothetical protein
MRFALALTCSLLSIWLTACSCNTESNQVDGAVNDGEPPSERLTFGDRTGGGGDQTVSPDRASCTKTDDSDCDGLSDADEKTIGTDPHNADTDGDGKLDGDEVGADPDHPKDTDGDGRFDVLEPSNVDSNGDSIPDESDPKEALCNGTPKVFVNVTQTQSLTLTKACSPYRVMSHLWMTSGSLLKAGAGVVIQFGPGASLILGDNNSTASLELAGASTDPVVLTSISATPKKGDWQGIVAENVESFSLGQVKIEYAGAQDPGDTDPRAAMLIKEAPGLSLSAVSVAHVAGAGLHAALQVAPATLFGAFTNCTFTDLDGAPALLNIRHLGEIGTGNNFATAGSSATIKVVDGLVERAVTWKSLGVPYEFSEATLTVDADLAIEAGVKLIMASGAVINVAYNTDNTGSLVTKGTTAAPVIFQTATPTPGSWQGIVLTANSHTLSNVTIRGAGHVSWTGKSASLYVSKDASLSPTAVTISESDGFGIYMEKILAQCQGQTAGGFTLTGSFPGDSAHPGCKFFCDDDWTGGRCVVGP